MKNYGFESTLNLVELSDAFRRHAGSANQDEVKDLVAEGRKVAVLSTYYYSEYPNLPENKRVDDQIRRAISGIAETAQRLNVDTVILPLAGDRRSWVARRVNGLLRDMDLPVRVTLQKGTYKTDLSALGPIDKRIRTALDEGVRGVMSIQQKLKYSWG